VEGRDLRFVQSALAAGVLDAATANRLLEARRAVSSSEPIEVYAMRIRILDQAAVARTFEFARSQPPPRSGTTTEGDPDAELLLDSDMGFTRQVQPLRAANAASSGTKKALKAPERFGPYEIVGEIARGGMGVVYRARGGGREVALKVLLEGGNASEDQVRRFEREIKTGLELDHPGIVKVFEGGRAEGKLYFTMELVSGSSLDKLLGTLDLRAKVLVLEKVARAVQHAHERGFIHRDLKPQNILVSAEGEPKVADFGLARSIDRQSHLTKTGAMVGTPYYMSPELAQGDHAHVDARTDVYALGAVLYQVIAGQLPFTADSALGLIGKIVNEDAVDPRTIDPSCPPELAAIALKALEKERTARFATAGALADELRRWLEGARVSTASESTLRRLFRRARRSRRSILLVVAGVLGAGLPGAFVTSRIIIGRRADNEKRRAQDEERWRQAIDSAAKLADAALGRKPRLELSELREALGEVDRAFRAPQDTAFPENRPVLERMLAELEGRRRSLEGLVLASDADDVRESELASLRTRIEKALARSPGQEDLVVALARVIAKQGSPVAAIALVASASSPAAFDLAGDLALELDDPRRAADSYKKALALEPARRSARHGLSRALYELGDPDALSPLEENAKDERVLRAEATWLRDRAAGIDLMRSAERERANDASLALRVAELLLRSERPGEARCAFDRAAELAPKDPRPLAGRAEAALLDASPAEALKDLTRAGEQAAPGSLARARARAREGELRALLDAPRGETKPSQVLVEAFSERADPLIELAALELEPEQKERDIERVANALGTRRPAARAWSLLAWREIARGDPSAATRAAQSALAIVPRDARALAALGALGDAAARHAAHVAFLQDGGDAPRFLRASIVRDRFEAWRHHESDARAAELLLALSEKLAPWAAAPRIERARRLARSGKGDEARALLEAALPVAGDDAAGCALLALLLLEKDEKANAPRALDLAARALALDARQSKALAARGRALLALERPWDALPELDRSLALDRRFADAWLWKARALEALGKKDEAEKARFEYGERTHASERASFYGAQGDRLCLNSQPRLTEGCAAYRRCLDLDPTKGLSSSRFGGQLIISGEEWPREALFRLSQGAYWDPGITVAEGSIAKNMLAAADVPGTADELAAKAAETGKVDDLFQVAFWLELAVECFHDRADYRGRARVAFERVLCADPTAVACHEYLGYLRALDGQTELAIQSENRVLEYFDGSPFAFFVLALADARAGRLKEAQAELQKAREKEASMGDKALDYDELKALLAR
jgi:predicted Zn-dependent protease/predicted Ser/Thr protein kinase